MWLNEDLIKNDDNAIGFIYKITNKITGDFYIGKKNLKCYRTIKGKKVIKESNWRNYWGSNKSFLSEIKVNGEENYKREIIMTCSKPQQLTYYEIEHIILSNWLKNDKSKNDNILGKFYRGKIKN